MTAYYRVGTVAMATIGISLLGSSITVALGHVAYGDADCGAPLGAGQRPVADRDVAGCEAMLAQATTTAVGMVSAGFLLMVGAVLLVVLSRRPGPVVVRTERPEGSDGHPTASG